MQITVAVRGSRDWADANALVRDKYRQSFAADVDPHPDCFIVVRSRPGSSGKPAACAGVTFAEERTLFSERYLDAPIDVLIGQREGRPVPRAAVMEIGSLASGEFRAGTELVRSLPMLAWCMGRQFALCTLTQQMRRMFDKLGLEFVALKEAGIERLDEASRAHWGNYYRQQPQTGYACASRMSRSFAANTGRYRFADIVVDVTDGAHAGEALREAA